MGGTVENPGEYLQASVSLGVNSDTALGRAVNPLLKSFGTCYINIIKLQMALSQQQPTATAAIFNDERDSLSLALII